MYAMRTSVDKSLSDFIRFRNWVDFASKTTKYGEFRCILWQCWIISRDWYFDVHSILKNCNRTLLLNNDINSTIEAQSFTDTSIESR